MTGKGLICKLGKHTEIPGADKIVQVTMFGETIITQKTNEEGTIGILFDCETQLSPEYASANNMYRHSELNQDKSVVGYMDDSARVKPIKLKGVKCSALFMPLSSLQFIDRCFAYDSSKFELCTKAFSLGSEISELDNKIICKKYISPKTIRSMNAKQGKARVNLVPTFKEHFDTDQWGRNSHIIKEGDTVIITEKLHGTSGRCGYLPVQLPKFNRWQRFWSNVALLFGFGNRNFFKKDEDEEFIYDFVAGSRRVVKSIAGEERGDKKHYYEEDLWTKISTEYFEGKLHKGETVYFEIVGYTPDGGLIMPEVSNKKLEKFLSKEEYKEFINRYGETTTFTYGTDRMSNENLYKVFVYRITMTNEDGDSLDLSWEQVKARCEQMGVSYTPELYKRLVDTDSTNLVDALNMLVEELTNQHSKEFPQHVREGVCIRIENGSLIPKILKHKSFIFKVLEGIIKDSDIEDIEESN